MWACGCSAFHRIWLVKEGGVAGHCIVASLQWQGCSQQRFRLRQLHVPEWHQLINDASSRR